MNTIKRINAKKHYRKSRGVTISKEIAQREIGIVYAKFYYASFHAMTQKRYNSLAQYANLLGI